MIHFCILLFLLQENGYYDRLLKSWCLILICCHPVFSAFATKQCEICVHSTVFAVSRLSEQVENMIINLVYTISSMICCDAVKYLQPIFYDYSLNQHSLINAQIYLGTRCHCLVHNPPCSCSCRWVPSTLRLRYSRALWAHLPPQHWGCNFP